MIEARIKELQLAGLGLESNDRVRLAAHDSHWVHEFDIESKRIFDKLNLPNAKLFHVGSTSIPGIYAKPILDILMAVPTLKELDAQTNEFVSLGYISKGEYGLEGRRYYVLSKEGKAYVHVHAWENDRPEIMRHLIFRSYLRSHPEWARKYEAVKIESLSLHKSERSKYQDMKAPIIDEIMSNAVKWATSPEAHAQCSSEWVIT